MPDKFHGGKFLQHGTTPFAVVDKDFVQSALMHKDAQFIFEDRIAVTLEAAATQDVSELLASYAQPSTADGELGPVVYAEENKVVLKNTDGTSVLDAAGKEVYARLTYNEGVYTLTYFQGDDVATQPAAPFDAYMFIPVEKPLGTVKRIAGTQAVGPAADPRYEGHLLGVSDRHEAAHIEGSAVLKDKVGAADVTVEAILDKLQDNVDAEANARTNADTAIKNELDATQTGAGLGADGTYSAKEEAYYISEATSLKDADEKLDAALKAEETARIEADNDLAQDLTDEITNRINADGALSTRIDNLASDFGSTAAEKGASLVGLHDAEDLFEADNVEDALTELVGMIEAVESSAGGDVSSLQNEVNRIETAAGLEADGTLGAWGDARFGGTETSLKLGMVKLSTDLRALETKKWFKGSLVITAAMLDPQDPAYLNPVGGYATINLSDLNWRGGVAPAAHGGNADGSLECELSGVEQEVGVGEDFDFGAAEGTSFQVKVDSLWAGCRIRVTFNK